MATAGSRSGSLADGLSCNACKLFIRLLRFQRHPARFLRNVQSAISKSLVQLVHSAWKETAPGGFSSRLIRLRRLLFYENVPGAVERPQLSCFRLSQWLRSLEMRRNLLENVLPRRQYEALWRRARKQKRISHRYLESVCKHNS